MQEDSVKARSSPESEGGEGMTEQPDEALGGTAADPRHLTHEADRTVCYAWTHRGGPLVHHAHAQEGDL